jgi:hypothetical protein
LTGLKNSAGTNTLAYLRQVIDREKKFVTYVITLFSLLLIFGANKLECLSLASLYNLESKAEPTQVELLSAPLLG